MKITNKTVFRVFVLLLTMFILPLQSQIAQQNSFQASSIQSKEPDTEKLNSIFQDIQSGLITNDVNLILRYISKHVKLNLRGSDNGYFSENQALYILDNYFSTRKVINYQFTVKKLADVVPYAIGEGYWNIKGRQEKFQAYITMYVRDNHWVITQFKIY
jgi:hypothetical protein